MADQSEIRNEDAALRDQEKSRKRISLTRRRFLTATAACGLGSYANILLKGPAASNRSLTIAFGWVPNCEYADVFVGMEKQHFADAGL
ncbi:MAG: hypothetical protein ACRD52_04595, partial [Candidatus Acidiferrales bacterium]